MVPEIRDRFRFSRIYRVISDKVIPARQRFFQATSNTQWHKPTVLGQMTRTQWRAADQPLFEDNQPTDSVYLALKKRLKQTLLKVSLMLQMMWVPKYILLPRFHIWTIHPFMMPTPQPRRKRHTSVHTKNRSGKAV